MIKARVAVEETYAKGLEKVANQVRRVHARVYGKTAVVMS